MYSLLFAGRDAVKGEDDTVNAWWSYLVVAHDAIRSSYRMDSIGLKTDQDFEDEGHVARRVVSRIGIRRTQASMMTC